MKAIEKVKQQRRIKMIPVYMFGFRTPGILQHGIDGPNKTLSQSEKRANRKHSIRSQSRKANRP